MVSAKSGTSFERAMSRRRYIALNQHVSTWIPFWEVISRNDVLEGRERQTHVIPAFKIQQSAHIQPSVTSPRSVSHPNRYLTCMALPAASAEKVMRMSAER